MPRALVAIVLVFLLGLAHAGTLDKTQVEAMFPPPWLVGEKLAQLPVWPVYTRTGQGPELQNYVFETADLEPVAGYGGKPINLLVVMDRDGAFVTARILSHMEPIFRSEEGTATLNRFAQQYQGVTVHHQIHVLGARAQRNISPTTATLHGIVAGTVTANAIDRGIMEAAAQVAQVHSDPQGATRQASATGGADDRFQRTGFNSLVLARLVQPWTVEHRLLEAAFKGTPAAGKDAEGTLRPQANGVDLWLAFVGVPQAGRNLLVPARWREVRTLREAGKAVLLIQDGGRYPLGTIQSPTQARGTTLQITQGGRRYALEALPWEKGLRISGQHSGVPASAVPRYFVAAPVDGLPLEPLQPMTLDLEIWRRAGQRSDDLVRTVMQRSFTIPEAQGWATEREIPKWLEAWGQRKTDLIVLGVALVLLTLLLVAQRRTAASATRLAALRLPFLAFTLVFIGWMAQGQLTIVSLTSLVEAMVAGRSTEFLLADPMAVVLWAYTFATLVVWGRGSFCGWLCPFGAMQELVAWITRRLGMAQRRLRVGLDRWLKGFKYIVLALVLAAAVISPELTEVAVEVEPFKTAISLYFQRHWPYVAWAAACLVLGTVVYRGYCRYVCPLGAALAILGRLRLWGWIPRRAECGTPCQTCRHRCAYQAIEPSGKIHYAECFQCLDCVQTHDDVKHCLPLVLEAKGKKFIPIRPVPAVVTLVEGVS